MSSTFFCIDAHTCGNPVRLVAGGGPQLDGRNMSEKRQHFLKEYGDEAKALEVAAMYGATKEKGQWGRQIGIYDRDKDRTVAHKCPDCDHEWPRYY